MSEIAVRVVGLESLDEAGHDVWLVSGVFVEGEGVFAVVEGVRLVVGLRS